MARTKKKKSKKLHLLGGGILLQVGRSATRPVGRKDAMPIDGMVERRSVPSASVLGVFPYLDGTFPRTGLPALPSDWAPRKAGGFAVRFGSDRQRKLGASSACKTPLLLASLCFAKGKARSGGWHQENPRNRKCMMFPAKFHIMNKTKDEQMVKNSSIEHFL